MPAPPSASPPCPRMPPSRSTPSSRCPERTNARACPGLGSGALLGKTAAELKAVAFKNTPERMMTLGDLCALVAGRVPLVIEVKSHFDGDRRLVKRMAEVLAAYSGPAVGMSFDPDQVLAL